MSMGAREYADLDAMALAAALRDGELTPREALDLSYGLIDRLDGKVNAFVAREEALARQFAANTSGPLAGVPIAMKDCVGLVGGARRDFGSRLSRATRIDSDEEVVVRLKSAGLVPLGTTNVPELSSSISTESVLHGPCRNPWNPELSAGGSTGGGAAAVACGMVPVAYGNDAAGSIRIPASCCGVFGFKPSRGRVPTGPVSGEIWFGLMVHHVITRSVRDSASILDLTEGIDAGAPYGAPEKCRPFIEEVDRPPGTLRIAVSDGSALGHRISDECSQALDATAALLRRLGHEVVEASPDYDASAMFGHLDTLMEVSLAVEIPALAAESGRDIGPDTLEACHLAMMERGLRKGAVALAKVLEFRNGLGRAMGGFFGDYDILLTPTLAGPPLPLGELNADTPDLGGYRERMWRFSPFTPVANFCGLPSMSVPLTWSAAGLPIGMMFSAPYGADSVLFALAGQLESAQPWRDRHPPISAWGLPGSE
jgi:amidase